MSINPIQGPVSTPPLAGPAEAKASEGAASFGETLKGLLSQSDAAQGAAHSAVETLLTNPQQDVLPVVTAMAKADLSFKLLIGVRNKVIDAYKQTLNMQV